MEEADWLIDWMVDRSIDHVGGVRLILWTEDTNGPIFHPQRWYERREPRWNDVDKGKLVIRPPKLSVNSTSGAIL